MNKQIKAILFDVDGIIIVERTKLPSERIAEEFNIPLADVREFFINDLKPCSMGKADLKEKLALYLPKWNFNGSVQDLLDFWFACDSKKDEVTLVLVKTLREQGIACFIATRQEKYRLAYLLNVVGLKKDFDGAFCTCEIGFDKCEEGYWRYVFESLGLQPEEIMFFDDSQKNVDMAKSLGVDAHFFSGRDVLERQIERVMESRRDQVVDMTSKEFAKEVSRERLVK
jgi:putative hydrolase of the HAD superfamily